MISIYVYLHGLSHCNGQNATLLLLLLSDHFHFMLRSCMYLVSPSALPARCTIQLRGMVVVDVVVAGVV